MIETNAKLYGDLKSILVTREEIVAAVDKLGAQITKDYEGKELLMVGILKGSVVFFADLMRAIDALYAQIEREGLDFLYSSYFTTCQRFLDLIKTRRFNYCIT